MIKTFKKTVTALVIAALIVSAFPFAACTGLQPAPTGEPVPTGIPIELQAFEQVERGGTNYSVIPSSSGGNCLVRTDCGLTGPAAVAAAEALLAFPGESGSAVIEKLIWANDEHIYIYGMRTAADNTSPDEDDAVVLALAKDGGGWQAEETLPYAQSLSLFKRIVEETRQQRSLSDEELQEAAMMCYNRAYSLYCRNSGFFTFKISSGSVPPVEKPLYSGDAADIIYSVEKSEQVLAELFEQRCAEESFSPERFPAVLFISSANSGFIFMSTNGGADSDLIASVSQPFLPYLIERDPETGELSGSVLENWTAITFDAEAQP